LNLANPETSSTFFPFPALNGASEVCSLPGEPNRARARILWIGGSPEEQCEARRLLESHFDLTLVPADVEAALTSMGRGASERPDVILAEIASPDGLGALRTLRANEITRRIPIILLCPASGDDSVRAALESGADDWLFGKYFAEELLHRVQLQVKTLRPFREADVAREFAGAELQARARIAELEQIVAETNARLDAKTKDIEAFGYLISHDLKAPLRGIDGYSRLLMEECSGKLDPEGLRFVKNICLATEHMTQLIDDLRTYSKVERLPLALARIDVRSLVKDEIAKRSADFKNVDLTIDLSDISVVADHEALALALRQVIDNALKFSKGTPQPSIKICARERDHRGLISIENNGVGFDMRHHDKIFGIFQKLHRPEDFPGTGIGLALTRKAIERTGGRVWAESQPSLGATFYLELPLDQTGKMSLQV
jgi:signal transduction histidine kinase